MIIEMARPIFKCETDEEIFFGRLHSLKGYENLASQGSNLYLNLTDKVDAETIQELHEICNFWNVYLDFVEN